MPALAPHLRLLDPARQHRLRRRANALAAGKSLEELGGIVTVEAPGIEIARDRLERCYRAANLLEHASSRADERPGKRWEVASL
jgi:hypothetical protein